MKFQYLPAIDLMDGCAVRLQKGDPEKRTVYSNDPVSFAKKWEQGGGDWLHIVDLDAAFSGTAKNLQHVAAICAAVSIPCELGGGIRDAEAVNAALQAGVARVIIGTRAAESLQFVRTQLEIHGPEKIVVGLDARDGFVAIKGWKESTALRAVDFARELQTIGLQTLIFTDIATDGMLQGPNFTALQEMASAVKMDIIASGGVSSKQDLVDLESLDCLAGAIIGKALYDGKISLPLRDLGESIS
jgi:phosphoribosylformimino-5-aminoimidazole carboxamide ribotide isomerase